MTTKIRQTPQSGNAVGGSEPRFCRLHGFGWPPLRDPFLGDGARLRAPKRSLASAMDAAQLRTMEGRSAAQDSARPPPF
jgi:hypothetical protein